ncbi:unnamed protein product [Sphagnum jensenii]|uniref:PORR domain-containing protein n=1 Tax=Sphagnum jensenii TaxID=128206 RepID=A0ABP0XF90_9BRYO
MAAMRTRIAIAAAFSGQYMHGVQMTQGLKTLDSAPILPNSSGSSGGGDGSSGGGDGKKGLLGFDFQPPKRPDIGIARVKEPLFDNVLEKEKQIRIIFRIRELLMRRPLRAMEIVDLAGKRRFIGLRGDKNLSKFLRRYPGIFEVLKEGPHSRAFGLTEQAERLYDEEVRLKQEMEDRSVGVLRKLLMLSIRRRLPLALLGQLANDLGIPDNFESDLVPRYPQFFRVEEAADASRRLLALVSWDPSLAVSFAQKDLQEIESGGPMSERVKRVKMLHLPKAYKLSTKHKVMLYKFRKEPFVSPYQDVSTLGDASPIRLEKHAVTGLHELLNLTLEKRILVDHLTSFTKDFTFSYKIRNLLFKHPHTFYVSAIGNRDTVFLREAYKGGKLLEKHPLILAKDQFVHLMESRRDICKLDEESDDEESDDEGSYYEGSDDEDSDFN